MQQISLTPFGRQPVTSGLLAARKPAMAGGGLSAIDKWTLFSALRVARSAFGITDRDLSVLYALLSFLPAKELAAGADLVVFPSNLSLSDRAHGMAESTLRRHLAALVGAGLIWRQDSPNGKRYAARGAGGAVVVAYGFDLSPLLSRAAEITRLAEDITRAAEALHRAREALVLRMRDAAKLLAYGRDTGLPGNWSALEARLLPLRAALRRKMDAEIVSALMDEAGDILRSLKAMLAIETEKMIASAAHFDRHHTESQKDSSESEEAGEKVNGAGVAPDAGQGRGETALPLALVLKACPDLGLYSRNNLTSWRDLVATAHDLRGMMGISPDAWEDAKRIMGPECAAITLSAILQRMAMISNPGGYLRALSTKAANAAFSPAPMIMALLSKAAQS